ncbi:hypothetical protein D5S17_05705 [Pseudonocardiaceae bacterium YIM PH 21723]|nr:hypothetical protein D5S17_05705 [Pseudonocardiaceae bacterium YIM PH 21723]
MRVMVAWWDLAESGQTIESMRAYLRDEGAPSWGGVSGLYEKFWISDRVSNRWGAVMIWEHGPEPDQQLPPHKALTLIGYPPVQRSWFDVEATAQGRHELSTLAGIGLALGVEEPG